MHTDNLRPFILNRRVQLDMLRPIPTRAGDHTAHSIAAIIYLDTCNLDTCNLDNTARDRCGRNSCNIGNIAKSILHRRNRALERSQIKSRRGCASACARTQCDADVGALSHSSTHIHIHTCNTYTAYMFSASLWPARELAAALVNCALRPFWRPLGSCSFAS